MLALPAPTQDDKFNNSLMLDEQQRQEALARSYNELMDVYSLH
jgi:hypothetical protein